MHYKFLRISIIIPLFFIFAFNASINAAASSFKKPSNKLKYFVAKIPFEYSNKLIKLNAKINEDTADFSFILDSGAPTLISDSIINNHQLKYIDTQNAVDANGNEQSYDLYKIKSFSLVKKRFENVKAINNKHVSKIPAVAGRANGGLIGTNVMENTIWMINYTKKEITMTNTIDSLKIPENYFTTKMFRNENGNPMIEVKLPDNKKLNLMVDLGYNGSILLTPGVFNSKIFNDSLSINVNQKISTAFDTHHQNISYKFIENINIGDNLISDVKASTTGQNTINLLGNEFLQNYTIVMDFINNLMIFIPLEVDFKNKFSAVY